MKPRLHAMRFTSNSRNYYIHWSFLLIIVWMLVINLISVIKPVQVIWAALLILAFLFSLLLHEAAHALAGRIFGFTEADLLILPSGSVGGGIDTIRNFRVKTLVLLAGPITNLTIAFLLKFFIEPYSAYWNEPANIGVVEPGNFLFQVHIVNLSLGVFNLIPILPADAGRVLRGALAMRIGPQKSAGALSGLTKWVALAALLIGFYSLNLLIILAAIYILLTWRAENLLEARIRQNPSSNSTDPIDFFLNHSHFS